MLQSPEFWNKDVRGIIAANSILELIGNTPLVRLDMTIPCDQNLAAIYGKLEFINPGGSIKDRIALKMIEYAEKHDLLKPDSTIIEPTSGNTGIGLAIVAALKGYRCLFVIPDKMSIEKIVALKAYGADVVITPSDVTKNSPESYYSVADRLTLEIPNAFQPNQFFNPNNPLCHYETTGPEIWRQTCGKIDYLVAGVGTGGTISGIGKYLKCLKPEVKVIGVDPEGSIYNSSSIKKYDVEGIGEDFIPNTLDHNQIDEWMTVSDHDAFTMCHTLARSSGILIGGSGGMAVAAAMRLRVRIQSDQNIVVIIPDSGRNYLSKIYNPEWMNDHGYY